MVPMTTSASATTFDITSKLIDVRIGAAHLAVTCEILKVLIQKGVLSQGDMVVRFEELSKDLMKRPGAEHSVPIVDIVRDFVAGEQERTLS
jgi:hypothetical protein